MWQIQFFKKRLTWNRHTEIIAKKKETEKYKISSLFFVDFSYLLV